MVSSLFKLLLATLILGPGCGAFRHEPVKLLPGYVTGKTQLEIRPNKTFRVTFDPMSRWFGLGPLEGEISQYEEFLALLPKTLNGRTEEQITQDAMKYAQETGQQMDLAGVYILMRTVKLDIGKEGKWLTVAEPKPNDPDKHPLSGAVFTSSL